MTSHSYNEERIPHRNLPDVWDSTGYFQKVLKENYGYELKVIDLKYQSHFIHYGAFSKNLHINQKNVAL
jgi:hypothetical protein